MEILMERNHSGLQVELIYDRETKTVSIHVVDGEEDKGMVEVPPVSAMDAFNHPFIYLSDQSLNKTDSRDIVASIAPYTHKE